MVSSVFKDLGFTDHEAQELERKSALMLEVEKYIERNNLTQSAAANILGVSQPRVSALLNGRMSLFSLDELVRLCTRTGSSVKISVRQNPSAEKTIIGRLLADVTLVGTPAGSVRRAAAKPFGQGKQHAETKLVTGRLRSR